MKESWNYLGPWRYIIAIAFVILTMVGCAMDKLKLSIDRVHVDPTNVIPEGAKGAPSGNVISNLPSFQKLGDG